MMTDSSSFASAAETDPSIVENVNQPTTAIPARASPTERAVCIDISMPIPARPANLIIHGSMIYTDYTPTAFQMDRSADPHLNQLFNFLAAARLHDGRDGELFACGK